MIFRRAGPTTERGDHGSVATGIVLANALAVLVAVGAVALVVLATAPAAETAPRDSSATDPDPDPAPCVATGPDPGASAPRVEVLVRRTDRGALRYAVTVERDPGARNVTVWLPEEAARVAPAGFVAADDAEADTDADVYVLSGERGTVAFVADPAARLDPGERDSYVLEPDWAFVPTPEVSVAYRGDGAGHCFSPFDRTAPATVVAAEGTVRHTAVALYLGTNTTGFRDASLRLHGRTVTVSVPGEVTADLDFADVATRLHSLRTFPCGSGAPVRLFVLPHEAGDGGFAIAPAPDHRAETVWVGVRSIDRDGTRDVLRHEYVHACQGYQTDPGTAPSMEWFDEASAEYFASLSAYWSGDASSAAVYASSAYQTVEYADPDLADAAPVLVDPGTDSEAIQYTHGEAVLLALDAKLRAHTGGSHTLADVVAWMNRREEPIDYDAFRAHVTAHADADVGRWLDAVVTEPTPIDQYSYPIPTPSNGSNGPEGSNPRTATR